MRTHWLLNFHCGSARPNSEGVAENPTSPVQPGTVANLDAEPSAAAASRPHRISALAMRLRSMLRHNSRTARSTSLYEFQIIQRPANTMAAAKLTGNTAVIYALLTNDLEMDQDSLAALAVNIDDLLAVQQESGAKPSKECIANFNAACVNVLQPIRHLDQQTWRILENLRNHINQELKSAGRSEGGAASINRTAIISKLEAELRTALNALPVQNDDGADVASPAPRLAGEADFEVLDRSVKLRDVKVYGNILQNPGGGDCLFHALSGRTMVLPEIIALRERIASVVQNDGARNGQSNAANLRERLSVNPKYTHRTKLLMKRHTAVPNAVLAHAIRIPGMYAGYDELKQWTLLEENRDTTVAVLQFQKKQGLLGAFRNGQQLTLEGASLQNKLRTADLVLVLADRHWEQLVMSKDGAEKPSGHGVDPKGKGKANATDNAGDPRGMPEAGPSSGIGSVAGLDVFEITTDDAGSHFHTS